MKKMSIFKKLRSEKTKIILAIPIGSAIGMTVVIEIVGVMLGKNMTSTAFLLGGYTFAFGLLDLIILYVCWLKDVK